MIDEVLWIGADPSIALAIVLRPRGGEWLRDELLRIERNGVQTLVSLLEPHEAELLGLAEEGPLAEEIGMEFLSHPIRDTRLPSSVAAFRSFAGGLADRLRGGDRIGVHCRASIGRATVAAACTLIHLGWQPGDAVAAVEKARCCPVPDTEEQLRWILDYKAQP
ncbi:MAG: protein-tyrosine phosphatase family protein [Terracidiphilus sp.]